MPWFRVDDSFPTHPKVLKIPRKDRPAVAGLWALAGAWCGNQLTDGNLEAHMLDEFGGTTRLASVLVTVGLWHRSDAIPDACMDSETCLGASSSVPGYVFHDWGAYNPTRAKVEAERATARERVRLAREANKAKRSAERAADVRANGDRSSDAVTSTPTRPDPTRPVSTSTPVAEVHPYVQVSAAGAT